MLSAIFGLEIWEVKELRVPLGNGTQVFRTFTATGSKPAGAVTVVGKGFESYVVVRDIIDVPKEKEKLKKTIDKTAGYVTSVEKKLANQAFVASAPAEIVEAERTKLAEAKDNLGRLTAYLTELG